MNENNDRLIEKIRKILALANHPGSNEEEASVAASMVQRLLEEHNLSMAQVAGASNKEQKAEAREQAAHTKSAMYRYQQDMMQALAGNNFCRWWMTKQAKEDPRGKPVFFPDTREWKKGRNVLVHVLVGSQINVTATRITYDYLVEAMDRILPYIGMDKRGKEALLWLGGCTERLVERLAEQRKEAERESRRKADEEKVQTQHPGAARTANALVTLTDVYGSEDDLNEDFVRGKEPGTTAREKREAVARAAAAKAERQVRYEAAIAKGYTDDVATYIAYGYSETDAIRMTAKRGEEKVEDKEETEAQRQKREAREKRQQDRWSEQAWSRMRKEQKKRDHPAYKAGKQAGDQISLNRQVDKTERRKLG